MTLCSIKKCDQEAMKGKIVKEIWRCRGKSKIRKSFAPIYNFFLYIRVKECQKLSLIYAATPLQVTFVFRHKAA